MTKAPNKARIGRPRAGKRAATHPYIEKHPDCPLSYHKGTGQFYKTHRGRRYYFGPDPIQAIREFNHDWSFIIRGLPVPEAVEQDAIRVAELVAKWIAEKVEDNDASGKPSLETIEDYRKTTGFVCDRLGGRAVVGLAPQDFTDLYREMHAKWGGSPAVFRRRITTVRAVFAWGAEMRLHGSVSFGPKFKPPDADQISDARIERGRQTYTPEELHKIIDAANPTLRAAVLLGVNGGYTQREVAALRVEWLDTDAGVLDHLRGKRPRWRRVPLWKETLAALEAMPRHRPGKDAKGLLFVTRNGTPYHRAHPKPKDGIGTMFDRLTRKLGIDLDQAGFGKLRATHRTASDGVLDDKACRVVMGQKLAGVDPNYIRSIDDTRLRAVTDHVHAWLFPKPAKKKTTKKKTAKSARRSG